MCVFLRGVGIVGTTPTQEAEEVDPRGTSRATKRNAMCTSSRTLSQK